MRQEQVWDVVLLYKERSKNKVNFQPEIENIFFDRLLSNKIPTVARTIYQPPSQSDLLKFINTHFSKLDTDNLEIYLIGDLNFTLYFNNFIFFKKNPRSN